MQIASSDPGTGTSSDGKPVTVAAVDRKSFAHGNILFFFGVLLLLTLAYKLLKELEIIYVAALFAVVLIPFVRWLSSKSIRGYHPSRVVSILLLAVTTITVLGTFAYIAVPPVISDARNFLGELPRRIPAVAAHLRKLPIANRIDLDTLTARAENFVAAAGAYLFNALPTYLAHIFDILTTIFLCIYFMLEGEEAYVFFLSLIAPSRRKRLDSTLKTAETKMSKWLFGQGLLMLILGVCSTIAFGFLHVRYFILLGVLMGLFNIIPIAGGVITICLVAIVAAFDSWTKMAGVLTFYLVYVNVENAFLTPRIMRSSVDLMGLTVLIALLLGTALAGIVGALVAVPTAALISVLLNEYAVRQESADSPDDSPGALAKP